MAIPRRKKSETVLFPGRFNLLRAYPAITETTRTNIVVVPDMKMEFFAYVPKFPIVQAFTIFSQCKVLGGARGACAISVFVLKAVLKIR